mgnify:CR=1 FL=1
MGQLEEQGGRVATGCGLACLLDASGRRPLRPPLAPLSAAAGGGPPGALAVALSVVPPSYRAVLGLAPPPGRLPVQPPDDDAGPGASADHLQRGTPQQAVHPGGLCWCCAAGVVLGRQEAPWWEGGASSVRAAHCALHLGPCAPPGAARPPLLTCHASCRLVCCPTSFLLN